MLTTFKFISLAAVTFCLLSHFTAVSQGAPPETGDEGEQPQEGATGAANPPAAGALPEAGEAAHPPEQDPTLLPQVNLIPCIINGNAADEICPDYSYCDQPLGACMADMCFNEFAAECPLGYVCNLNVKPAGENVDPEAGTCEAQACGAGAACPEGFNCGGTQCAWIPQ